MLPYSFALLGDVNEETSMLTKITRITINKPTLIRYVLSPGSAGSLAKSMRSEMGESGSESGGVDGDNINVVIR